MDKELFVSVPFRGSLSINLDQQVSYYKAAPFPSPSGDLYISTLLL